jgi:hypothetical protein
MYTALDTATAAIPNARRTKRAPSIGGSGLVVVVEK